MKETSRRSSIDIKDILLFVALGLLPLFWFNSDYINGGDFDFPMAEVGEAWKGYANVWVDKWALGLVNSRAIPQLPFIAALSAAGQIGLSAAILERVLFFTLFFISGLSIYLITRLLLPERYARTAAIFAGLFYALNPFNVIFHWHILDGMIFIYALFPLLLFFYLKWFMTGRLVYAALFLFSTFMGGYTFSNPLMIPILWILLFVFTFLARDCSITVAGSIRFFFKAMIIWVLLNSWWFLPLLGSIKDEYAGLSATIGTPWDTLEAFSSKTSLLNLLRIGDLYWAFTDKFFDDPYYTYATQYSTAPFVLISFLFPLIIFSPLLLNLKLGRETPRFMLLIYGLTLFYLFLAKGSHTPYGKELYAVIFKLPLLSSFRAPVHKLGVLIGINYAILFGYGIASIYNFLRERSSALSFASVGLLGISTLVIYPYPLWTGEVIHKGGKDYPSFHVEVPDYYYEAASWMDRDRDYFRYYSMPQSPSFNVVYKWEKGFIGADPKQFIFSKPGVYSTVDERAQLPYTLLHDTEEKNIYRLFTLQNVRYVLFHNDINEKLWDIFTGRKVSIEHLKKRLKEQNNISFVRSFGKLDIYKISDGYFLPNIYPSEGFTLVSSDVDSLASMAKTPCLDGHPAVVFTERLDDKELLSLTREKEAVSGLLFVHAPFDDVAVDMASAGQKLVKRKATMQNTLTSGAWKEKFYVPEDSNYSFRLYEPSGAKKYASVQSDAKVTIDGSGCDLAEVVKKGRESIFECRNVFLKKGEHAFAVEDGFTGLKIAELKPERENPEPRISFVKLSPTRYVVDVKEAKGPFTLVLSENFHKGWKAYLRPPGSEHNSISFFSSVIETARSEDLKMHFMVNGYSNGWYAPSNQWKGISNSTPLGEEFQIVLEFRPQRMFEAGVGLTVFSLLGCIGYLFLARIKR